MSMCSARHGNQCMKLPSVSFTWRLKTHELESDLEDGIGKIHLGYDISVSGEWQYYNQLDIVLQEDLEYGTKGQAQARN